MTWQLNKCSSDLVPRQKKIDFHLTTRNLHALHCGRQRNTSLSISALHTHTLSYTLTLTHISPVAFPEGELQEVTLVTLEFNPSAMLSLQVPSIKLFQTSLKLSYQHRQHFLC